jgi:hypothetical protein
MKWIEPVSQRALKWFTPLCGMADVSNPAIFGWLGVAVFPDPHKTNQQRYISLSRAKGNGMRNNANTF